MEGIVLVKKVTKIVFEDKNKYEDEFAKQLANNNFQIYQAYQTAYKDVTKVKASVLLQNPRIWQIYFEELSSKNTESLNDIEQDWLDSYNKVKEMFEISPFEAFVFYVENYKDLDKPIAELISDNPVQNVMILAFLYKFFYDIEREYYYTKTKERLLEEIEQIELTAKRDQKIYSNFESTKKMLYKNHIYLDQIIKCDQ